MFSGKEKKTKARKRQETRVPARHLGSKKDSRLTGLRNRQGIKLPWQVLPEMVKLVGQVVPWWTCEGPSPSPCPVSFIYTRTDCAKWGELRPHCWVLGKNKMG